jgi:glycosyltransferase involved in cell wall biosynthesis
MSHMKKRIISIVIPTYNNEGTLPACLSSIREQDCTGIEVIVVDGFSTDGTLEIAKGMADKVIQVKGPPPLARNEGFRISKGDIFVSIDSDMILGEGLLAEIPLKMEGFDALVIPETGVGDDFISRCKDLEKRCYIGDEVIEAARVFSRDAFNRVSGYDRTLVFGEDWDLHARLKERSRIGRTESKVMHDVRQTSLMSDLKKAYKYGYSVRRYIAKNHPQAKQWRDLRRSFFIRNAPTLLKEPLEAAGLAAIKGAEYAVGFVGLAHSYISQPRLP